MLSIADMKHNLFLHYLIFFIFSLYLILNNGIFNK